MTRSAVSLLAGNALTLAVALWQRWPLLLLLWPYLMQSIIIGWYAHRRMLAVNEYVVGDLSVGVGGRKLREEEITPQIVAGNFAFLYGGFHVGYLICLVAFAFLRELGGGISRFDWLMAIALCLPFWFAHRHVHRQQTRADSVGRPVLADLVWGPFARVLPMHATLVVGAALTVTLHPMAAIIGFVALKTAADLWAGRWDLPASRRTSG